VMPLGGQPEEMSESLDRLERAHAHASGHRAELERGRSCGCFHCCSIFPASQILEWIDDDDVDEQGQTALCPHCGIDAVIGDQSGFLLSRDFLEEMRARWFEGSSEAVGGSGRRRPHDGPP